MMFRNIIFLLIISTVIFACNNSGSKKSGGQAKIEFTQTEFDFGTIKHGEKVSHRFTFRNVGEGELIIKDVEPGCGCTVVSFPNSPVEPGEESFIEATFDSEGFSGLNIKYIEVKANTKPSIVNLTISATVERDLQ